MPLHRPHRTLLGFVPGRSRARAPLQLPAPAEEPRAAGAPAVRARRGRGGSRPGPSRAGGAAPDALAAPRGLERVRPPGAHRLPRGAEPPRPRARMAPALHPAARRRRDRGGLRLSLSGHVLLLSVGLRSAPGASERRPDRGRPLHQGGGGRGRHRIRLPARRRGLQVSLGPAHPRNRTAGALSAAHAGPALPPGDRGEPGRAPDGPPRAPRRGRAAHRRRTRDGGSMTGVRRAYLKPGLGLVLGWPRTDRLIQLMSGTRRLPLVVGYHRVVDDSRSRRASIIAPMLVSRRMFERQLDWMGRRFRFVSLDQLGAQLESGGAFRTPTATITFDDGYRDMYEHAYPVLKRKGIPAAVFVVTDWIGRASALYHDRLYLLLTRDWPASREVLIDLGVMRPEQVLMARGSNEPFAALRHVLTTQSQEGLARVIAALEEKLGIDSGRLDGLRPLSWAMLAEMQRGGVITVG